MAIKIEIKDGLGDTQKIVTVVDAFYPGGTLNVSTKTLRQLQTEINKALGDGWISVDDPPKNNDEVLICDAYCTNTYSFPYNVEQSYRLAFYENDLWHPSLGIEDTETYEDVTHWRPLPAPPQETTERVDEEVEKPVCPECGDSKIKSPGNMMSASVSNCDCQEEKP
jgi:hypothetical protein